MVANWGCRGIRAAPWRRVSVLWLESSIPGSSVRTSSFGKPAVLGTAGQLPRCVSRDRTCVARCKSDTNACPKDRRVQGHLCHRRGTPPPSGCFFHWERPHSLWVQTDPSPAYRVWVIWPHRGRHPRCRLRLCFEGKAVTPKHMRERHTSTRTKSVLRTGLQTHPTCPRSKCTPRCSRA